MRCRAPQVIGSSETSMQPISKRASGVRVTVRAKVRVGLMVIGVWVETLVSVCGTREQEK